MGSLRLRQALQIADDDRGSIRMGQSADLFVQDSLEIILALVARLVLDGNCPPGRCLPIMKVTTGGDRPGLPCRPGGDPVEPVAQKLARSKLSRLASQHEERRLKCILGCMCILKGHPANVENHWPVTLDDGLESQRGRSLISGYKLFQELGIGHSAIRSQTEKPIELAAGARWFISHRRPACLFKLNRSIQGILPLSGRCLTRITATLRKMATTVRAFPGWPVVPIEPG
jgi:hypothetical protein